MKFTWQSDLDEMGLCLFGHHMRCRTSDKFRQINDPWPTRLASANGEIVGLELSFDAIYQTVS